MGDAHHQNLCKTMVTNDEVEPEPEELKGKVANHLTVDFMRELEKLELALVEERQRSAALLEESQAAEAAHQRDVAALEEMLQMLLENMPDRNVRRQSSCPQSRGGFTRFSFDPNSLVNKPALGVKSVGS